MRIFFHRAAGPPLLPAASVGLVLLVAASFCKGATGFSANGTLTTDYVWRGITQTAGDPAVQAGLGFSVDSGFYASLWGSNVDFGSEAGAHAEVDLAAGWSGDFASDWALDVHALHYRYPGARTALDWTELDGTVTYARNCWLSIAYSPDALGSGRAGLYMQLGARVPIRDRFRLEGALGHYALNAAYGESYRDGQLSAIWTLRQPLELRITAHATDSGARRIFGESNAGSRIEAALQASF